MRHGSRARTFDAVLTVLLRVDATIEDAQRCAVVDGLAPSTPTHPSGTHSPPSARIPALPSAEN